MASKSIAFVAALIDEKRTAYDWVQYGNLEPLFISKWEKGVHAWVHEYIRLNGQIPPRDILQKQFDDPFLSEGASAYAYGEMKKRYIEHCIRSTGAEASAKLEDDDFYDPEAALGLLGEMVQRARMSINPTSIMDSLEAIPQVWQEYLQKLNLSQWEKGLALGWPSVDVTTGGIEGGEVVSIVGRPATGKTWFLLWIALKGWEQQRRCAFVTLEMPAKQIVERQIGVVTGTDYGPIKSKIAMPEMVMQKVGAWIADIKKWNVPFYIIDSRMASTVPDLESYIRAIDCSVVYIDGAYLLRHADARMNRYQRVAENMDMLKDMAMRLNIPVICSWQFNRDAAKKFKKKTADDPDLEDIGYSDAIGQHSSIVLGLLQDENLDTVQKRLVHVLKGRGGETGSFYVAWDFLHSFFGEVDATIEKDAIFLD